MTHSMQENEEEKEEYVDIKFLLKQVYAAHMSKIKELQAEVIRLKEELKIKERSIIECPKCKEMEIAYSACKEEYKSAVLEQTRRLKELEAKFAAFDRKAESAANKNTESKIEAATLPHDTLDLIPESLKFTESDTLCRNIEKPLKYYADVGVALDSIENIVQVPFNAEKQKSDGKNNQLLSSVESRFSNESADNSVILVPETMEMVPNTPDLLNKFIKKKSLSPKSKNTSGKENHDNKNSSSPIKKKNPLKASSRKRTFHDQSVNNEVQNEVKESASKKIIDEKDVIIDSDVNHLPTTSNAKRKKFQKQKGWSENFKDFGSPKKSNSSAVPSDKPKQPISVIDDDDDFQSPHSPSEDPAPPWKSKVAPKKPPNIKFIKSTSRYKMTFDANNVIKKANYKQTKLSVSTFQPNKKSNNESQNFDSSNDVISNVKSVKKGDESTLVGLSELASLVDAESMSSLDAEHNRTIVNNDAIEVNYSPRKKLSKSKAFQKSVEDGGEQQAIPRTASQDQQPVKLEIDENNEENVDDKKSDNRANLFDSFDRIPDINDEPNYKYKEESCRNKQKRKQLKGFECKDCAKYYDELGLSESEKKERMNHCSKHRAKHLPPPTPEHFWELDFPDTEECKLRGYINDTQKVELKQRRRRPLNID